MGDPNIVAIIQARLGSSRLPGKVLLDLQGREVLWHVVTRVRASTLVNRVVVATTQATDDDLIEAFCRRETIECFRGSETDVLDRYSGAASAAGADAVVRITADCPLLDPGVVDRVIRRYLDGDFDYVSNVLHPTFPDGLDVEVMSRQALERVWREARLPSEREHVTSYIRTHPERFRVDEVCHDLDLSMLRWTLDEPADLAFIRAVYGILAPPRVTTSGEGEQRVMDCTVARQQVFDMADVLELMRRWPELRMLNSGVENTAWLEQARREQLQAEAARSTDTPN